LVCGLYLIFLSGLFGISGSEVLRMLLNLAVDVFAGYIPIFGTAVDVAFKCNLANLAILESHVRKSKWAVITIPRPRRWFDWSALGREGKGGRASSMTGF